MRTIAVWLVLAGVTAAGAAAAGATVHHTPTDTVAGIESQWRAYLRKNLRTHPGVAYPSPRRAILNVRLQREASEYGFRVVSVDMLHEGQVAPLVIVAVNGVEKTALAHSTPAILHDLNSRSSRAGEDYVGFFFELLDETGVPFAATWDVGSRNPRSNGSATAFWGSGPGLWPFHPMSDGDLPICKQGQVSTKVRPCQS